MLPIEALNDTDKNKIVNYALLYGGASYICPIDRLLRIWNQSKTKLFEKLGNKLITSIPVEYEISERQMENIIQHSLFGNTAKTKIQTFINDFYNATEEARQLHHCYTDYFGNLFNLEYLAKNRLGQDYSFLLKDGKRYKVNAGTKTMKVIRKIAESYQVDNFDAFCNEHSLCLNQKKLKGELCISIHPLDYMTMSDNDSNWHTCMSWINNGEYKQGTIEMMNSPCVVVAYLKGAEDWYFDSINTWNDKKWRSLFIVDDNMILSVKNYPYANEYLTKLAIKKIAETIGWGNIKVHNFEHDCAEQTIEGHNVYVCTETMAMYNDFESTDHFIGLNPNLVGDIYSGEYYYSGPSMCIQCGGIEEVGEDQNESLLVCTICHPKFYCDCCGDVIYTATDEYEWVDEDTILCGYCAERGQFVCPITHRRTYDADCFRLTLRGGNSSNKNCLRMKDSCWRTHPEEWKKYFLIKEPHSEMIHWTWYAWVNVEELTEAGKELFKNHGIYLAPEDELPF